MILGFTGTRKGMTDAQRVRVRELVFTIDPEEARHGDCVGADADFHQIVTRWRTKNRKVCPIVGHPPIKTATRAYCKFDVENPPFEYIKRDHDIVDASDHMFACPAGMSEELRSGTWATVRYAVRTGVPVTIVWPDGSTERR